LAAVFSQETASAVAPIWVVASTIKAASMFAAGPVAAAGAISVPVGALTEGVLKAMLLAKLRILLIVIVALALAGAGVAHRFVQMQAAETQETAQLSLNRDSPAPGRQAAAPKQGAERAAAVRGQEFLNEALKEFEAAGDQEEYRLMADMAGLQAQLGYRAAAKKLFKKGSDLIAAAENGFGDGWQWLAVAMAHAGEVDEAITAASGIPEGKDRDDALQQVAKTLARNRLQEEALRVADMVKDKETKIRVGRMVLEELALAYAAAGKIPEALRFIEQMKNPSSQITALLGGRLGPSWAECPWDPGVALAQAKAGDKAEAMKTLERTAKLVEALPTDETVSRFQALTALACVQARLGEFTAARKTAEGIPIQRELRRASALATLVRQLARVGRAKEAMTEIDRLPAGATKVYALMHFGAGQAEAGARKAARASFDQAHRLIGGLQDKGIAIDLATVRADAGDYEGAIQTADAYFPDNDLGYANIANSHAKAGDFKGALEVAEKIKDGPGGQGPGWWKLNILRYTAAIQAQRGESKAALKWIDGLDSHLARAYALTGLAEGMAPATRLPGKK
jgi:tetratricopeptide (TPR) repeat protein